MSKTLTPPLLIRVPRPRRLRVCMVSVHDIEEKHEEFVGILLICASKSVVYFPDCGDEVCRTKRLGGVRTDRSVHAGEDCVDGAVDAVLTGAEVGMVGVGKVMVSDDGVVNEGLKYRGHVTGIS